MGKQKSSSENSVFENNNILPLYELLKGLWTLIIALRDLISYEKIAPNLYGYWHIGYYTAIQKFSVFIDNNF